MRVQDPARSVDVPILDITDGEQDERAGQDTAFVDLFSFLFSSLSLASDAFFFSLSYICLMLQAIVPLS